MQQLLSPKQVEFVRNCTKQWNLAHGPVSSGKTMGTLFAFMHAVYNCPDSMIWMIGKTCSTIYQNVISLLMNEPAEGIPDPLAIYRPFCNWRKSGELLFRDKTINILGAKDEGAIGLIQGKTMSLVYCDEMTLYPESVIDMIDTRLRLPHSKGFASMNPSHPNHKLKQWIDKAAEGNANYYALQFMIEDNPYLDDTYRNRIKDSLSGIFYKRNYLGLWCLAEGAIFDFFDRKSHVLERPPHGGTDYYVAGVDVGTVNAFACVLVGVSTGRLTQQGKKLWVEKEYYWDSKKQGRQKTNSEYAREIAEFLDPYGVRAVYIDPSAAAMKEEFRRVGIKTVDANNDVDYGLQLTLKEMKDGNLYILDCCTNLIKEIEGYVWDPSCAKKGWDEPLKQNDHAIDALRYVIASHKVSVYDEAKEMQRAKEFQRNKYDPWRR